MPSSAPDLSTDAPWPSSASSVSSSSWQADGRRLVEARGGMAAAIDLDAPRQGVRPQAFAGVGGLLGVDLPSPFRLSEHWLRADDAAAVYESADAGRLRITAMWRRHAAPARVQAWELILSTQTSLLHADPRLTVVSLIPFQRDAPGCTWGEADADGSWIWSENASTGGTGVLLEPRRIAAPQDDAVVVIGHPREVRGMEVRRETGVVVVAAPIFAGDLEKGVLLRGRVLAAIGPAAGARAWAGVLARTFADSAPMLST